jgi:hypothetical protein
MLATTIATVHFTRVTNTHGTHCVLKCEGKAYRSERDFEFNRDEQAVHAVRAFAQERNLWVIGVARVVMPRTGITQWVFTLAAQPVQAIEGIRC